MNKPGSIRESHLSQQFELKHNKLQKADEGAQLLVAEDNADANDHRQFKPVTVHGDGTLDGSGKLTVNFPETPSAIVTGDGLTEDQKQKLDGIEEGATRDKTPAEVKAAYEENSDTNAFTDSNRNQLDSTHSSYLANVANHTGHATAYEYTATSLSNVSQSPSTFTHNLGYIPDVTVYQSDGQDPPSFSEIDAEVKSTTTSTDVTVSEGGVSMKVIIK